MSELAKAVARSGAIDEVMLRELYKWKLPVTLPEKDESPFYSSGEACAAIEDAQSGQDQVEVKATDLDVLRDFSRTRVEGKLHIVTETEQGTFKISFGRNRFGEYIIPWSSDSMVEPLTNGESYILDNGHRVYISDVRALYFGSERRFIVCVPRVAMRQEKE